MSKQVEHYLLTLYLGTNMHLHGYLMTADERDTLRALNYMVDIAEKTPGGMFMPITLQTKLDSGVEIVREILNRNEEHRRSLKEAKDFHISVFAMIDDDPDDIRLMKLH